MKNYIVVAFTLKGQDFEQQILPALKQVAADNPDCILIHGFMTRTALEEKGFGTEVVDALDELFPDQKLFFSNGAVDRDGMKNFAYENRATAYIIGRVKDGVKDELVAYVKAGINIKTLDVGEQPEKEVVDNETGQLKRFTEADLVSFGNYLFSDKRKESLIHPETNGDVVNISDILNWFDITAIPVTGPEEKNNEANGTGSGNNLPDNESAIQAKD